MKTMGRYRPEPASRPGGAALFRVGVAMTCFIVAAGMHAPLVDAGLLAPLAACDWRIAGAGGGAVRLGLHPTTLRSRMGKHGLSRETVA